MNVLVSDDMDVTVGWGQFAWLLAILEARMIIQKSLG